MAVKKKPIKASAVRVETKKLTSSCSTCSCSFTHLLLIFFLLINTVLLVWMFVRQTNAQKNQVWWRENYKMVQEIYKTDMFKQQQKEQIEQALQMYKWDFQMMDQMPMMMPEEEIIFE